MKEEYGDAKEFLKDLNNHRKNNPNKWITFYGIVCGKAVRIKSYDTYLQIFRVCGVNIASGLMEQKVGAWKKEIEEGIC